MAVVVGAVHTRTVWRTMRWPMACCCNLFVVVVVVAVVVVRIVVAVVVVRTAASLVADRMDSVVVAFVAVVVHNSIHTTLDLVVRTVLELW